MSFILAGLLAIAAIGFWLLSAMASGMSDSVGAAADAMRSAKWVSGICLACAVLIAATHWVGW